MRIKMLVSLAGADFALSPGEETERFPDAEAVRLVEAGFAVPVTVKATETATKKPAPETRAKD